MLIRLQISLISLLFAYTSPFTCLAAGNEVDNLMRKADVLIQQHENKSALSLYRKAVKLDPKSSKAHAGLGWALFNCGDKQLALQEVRKAVWLDPGSAQAHHYLAMMYFQTGQLQKAADEFRKEYAIDPKRECHCGALKYFLRQYPARKKIAA